MSLLDRLRACHRHDLAPYRHFTADGRRIGWVHRSLADRLRGFPRVFHVADAAVALIPAGYAARTAAMADVVAALHGEGLVTGWRDEPFAVAPSFHAAPLFQIERAAVKAFGIRYYCVQLNGLVGSGAAQRMWIARRAQSKPIGPGKLDQIVGGGVPLGLSLTEALIKESAEEAGMAEALARQAKPVGATAILAEEDGGLWNEVLFNYDLALPEDFVPQNADGEVESFRLMPVKEVRRILETADEFLFDAVPILSDCLMRHGHFTPEDANYVRIAELVAAAAARPVGNGMAA